MAARHTDETHRAFVAGDDEGEPCDCPIGQDHDSDGGLSVSDAADIWAGSGFDEDSMFGYTEDELRAQGGLPPRD
jgi:hypothetical protein